jgi:hypothetical protein
MKRLRGDNDIEATLQRLDRLTLDEARATAAQTLEVIYGLVRHRRVTMDGKIIVPVPFFRSMLNIYTQTETNLRLASQVP